jgi:hypothetical protein
VAKPTLFLETSVQVKRRIGASALKKAINNAIDGQRCVSSFYVLMEYKRVLVKSLIELWGLVNEEDSLAEALHVFAEDMQPRKPKLILDAVATLLAEGDLVNDKTRALREIEMLIEASLVSFDKEVERLIDDRQACPLARASTTAASLADGYARFLREITCVTKCKVDVFWKANKANLERLFREGQLEPHSKNKGFADVLPNIDAASKDPSSQKTVRKCKRCGDTIIALEAPPAFTLVTFDRAFESFGAILEKPIKRLESLAAIRRE